MRMWDKRKPRVGLGRAASFAFTVIFALSAAVLTVLDVGVPFFASHAQASQPTSTSRKVKGRMQTRPGGPIEEAEVTVHEVPVNLPTVPVDKAPLEENDLVLGVVIDGQATAYPIRFLSMYEVVNDRVGRTPVAPTW